MSTFFIKWMLSVSCSRRVRKTRPAIDTFAARNGKGSLSPLDLGNWGVGGGFNLWSVKKQVYISVAESGAYNVKVCSTACLHHSSQHSPQGEYIGILRKNRHQKTWQSMTIVSVYYRYC